MAMGTVKDVIARAIKGLLGQPHLWSRYRFPQNPSVPTMTPLVCSTYDMPGAQPRTGCPLLPLPR